MWLPTFTTPTSPERGDMGLTVSTSFGKLRDNSLLLRFVGKEHISENDEFWDSLLTFSFSPPKQT